MIFLPRRKPIFSISRRALDSHKGMYGRVTIIAGSPGMIGAAILAGRGALKSGAGWVVLGVPQSLVNLANSFYPELMVIGLEETRKGLISPKNVDRILHLFSQSQVGVIGPGLGRSKKLIELVNPIAQLTPIPLVIDADALNHLKVKQLQNMSQHLILTPHKGEFSRLLSAPKDVSIAQQEAMIDCYSSPYLTWVLKSHHTTVIQQSQRYVNLTGNPGMAIPGSGDVLSGIIAAFVGRGYSSYHAAQCGVYVHGLAGDFLRKRMGMEEGLCASSIAAAVPHVMELLKQ